MTSDLTTPPLVSAPSRLAQIKQWFRANLGALIELTVIGLWAMWVGRVLLDFNPQVWPQGRELGSQLSASHFWTRLQHCGLCALWNSNVNGGYPALADIFADKLHPVVALTTLAWGVINGTKISFIASLWMGGVAQWWLARSLGVGRVARLWSAFIVVVGGHLVGRAEIGAYNLTLSIAASSLALAAAVHLGGSGTRRASVLLALLGAMAIVAGQGYLQLALLCWAPALLFFLWDEDLRLRPVWREFGLAFGLAILLAGIFIVPVAHFWPNLSKFNDTNFESAQELAYLPLNLVISDWKFYNSDALGKLPFPYLYNLFIGWTPILLAVLPLRFAQRKHYPALFCLATGAGLMFVFASAAPLKWLAAFLPEIAGFRHPPLIASLAVPAILGLAAYGLDGLLKIEWPQIILRQPTATGRALSVSLAWILVVPLVMSLRAAYTWNQGFIKVDDLRPVYKAVESLHTPSLQWLTLPFGEHYWVEPALNADLKVADVIWAWGWKDRPAPPARLIASRDAQPPNTTAIGQITDVPVYEDATINYAYILAGEAVTPCPATGSGGDLIVKCSTATPGQLIVQENSWTGWQVWRDGARVELADNDWLGAEAPAGEHTYEFHYRPWDVPLGLLLTVIGLGLCLWLWARAPAGVPASVAEAAPPAA
jgi:hypothetical protein